MKTKLQLFVFLISFFLVSYSTLVQAQSKNFIKSDVQYAASPDAQCQNNFQTTQGNSHGLKAACDTLNLALYKNVWTIVSYYMVAMSTYSLGWVNGVNDNGDKAKANYFANSGANTYIIGGLIAFSRAYSTVPSKTITMKVWQNSGGTPGAELASKTFTMQQIMDDVNGNYFTNVIFDNPVNVGGLPFFMGVDFSNLNWTTSHDTLCIQSNTDPETTPSAVWEKQSDNLWYHYTSVSSWNLNISLAVFPAMANILADASFTQSTTNTCAGYPVQLNASASVQNSVHWVLQGGTPSSSINVTPTVKYNAAGTYPIKLYVYGGSCNNLDSMITSITIIPSPVPNASATPPDICIGESTTLSAQNGVFYQWTGYPPAPFPTQTVQPSSTTSYTVTVTGYNNCSSSQTVTVNVHLPPDPAAQATPPWVCIGDATLISATPGMTTYFWSPGSNNTAAFAAYPGITTTYTVDVTDQWGCTNTDTVTVLAVDCSGIEDLSDNSGISITPNPSNGFFDLLFEGMAEGEYGIVIYNIEGQVIHSDKIVSDIDHFIKHFDVSALSPGMYYIKVNGNKRQLIRKLMVR